MSSSLFYSYQMDLSICQLRSAQSTNLSLAKSVVPNKTLHFAASAVGPQYFSYL